MELKARALVTYFTNLSSIILDGIESIFIIYFTLREKTAIILDGIER